MTLYFNTIVQEDLTSIASALPVRAFNGKRILVTGANGMIATYLVYFFVFLKRSLKIDCHITALVRNERNAYLRFKELLDGGDVELICQDVCDPINTRVPTDYIFHFAGNASPYYIKNTPVDILKTNLLGTINVLDYARISGAKVLFASTREVYGAVSDKEQLSEDTFGSLNCLENRACYPESKRAAEALCKSYLLQYGIKFNSLRIAHSYGPGMKLVNDGRVMADFISAAVEGRDIEMQSSGLSLRSFCYVSDLIVAILLVTLKGENGLAYNIANEKEEISVKELAGLILNIRKNSTLNIKLSSAKFASAYCDYRRVPLNTNRIQSLGWQPRVSLDVGISRTLESFLDEIN